MMDELTRLRNEYHKAHRIWREHFQQCGVCRLGACPVGDNIFGLEADKCHDQYIAVYVRMTG